MNDITVKRYPSPIETGWAGYIEPKDKTWILFGALDGTCRLFPDRDPETGVVLPPDPITRAAVLDALAKSPASAAGFVGGLKEWGRTPPGASGYLGLAGWPTGATMPSCNMVAPPAPFGAPLLPSIVDDMPAAPIVRAYTHPAATGWAYYIEPPDRSWITFVGLDGRTVHYPHRDEETGAALPDDPAERAEFIDDLRAEQRRASEEGGYGPGRVTSGGGLGLRTGMPHHPAARVIHPPGQRSPLEPGEPVFPLGVSGGRHVVPLLADETIPAPAALAL